MLKTLLCTLTAAATLLGGPDTARAQTPPDPAALISAQQQAMRAFEAMNGTWRGKAWIVLPTGEKRDLIQTERIGPFLQGAVKVIEGRGYNLDGTLAFNAFAVVSYDPATQRYRMRSHAQGQVGDFTIQPTADGYTWEIPAGPVTIRYTASIKNGRLFEFGERLMPGREPVRFFEMDLQRIGDSDWPAAGAIGPR